MKSGMNKTKKPCNRLITRFLFFLKVTQLGFEPRTPSLKGMCSTN